MATRYTDQHPQFTVFVNGVFSPASDGEVEFFTVGNTGESNRKNTFNTPNPSTPPLTSEINQNPVPLDGEGKTTVPVFLEGTYNTIIRDKAGNQLDQVDNVTGLGGSGGEGVPSATIENVAELREVDTLSIQNAYVISTATAGDGGQGHFYFDENATETDNGESVIEPTIGGGRWLLQNNAHNSFIYSQAAGTVDAITFNPTPVITTLDKTRFFVIQSLGPNTVTGVTVTAGTSSTLPMKRDDSTDLVVGDTGSAGYQMLIKTNEDQTRYILMNPAIPATPKNGFISMWSGSIASIPTNWSLCDGSNGTPDLRDKFILSVGAAEEPGATGGQTDGSATATSSSGGHTPTGSADSHTLTISEIPAHSHTVGVETGVSDGVAVPGTRPGGSTNTSSVGGGGGHTHTLTMNSVGDHTHNSTNNFPSYFKLAFIMFTP
jgi:hypothetical protein